jgi:glycosyltransferase involved in cell wall biosynthesis
MQTTQLPFEVVIVDNEPDPIFATQVDMVVQSFNSPNLSLYRNEANIGMAGNWNRCITLARGDWFTILNDDDLLKTDFLSIVWNVKSSRTSSAFIAANVEHFGGEIRTPISKTMIRRVRDWVRYSKGKRQIGLCDVLWANPVMATLGVLYDKGVAVALGGFNENCWPTFDYVFNVKYWLKCGGEVIPNRLASYRWGENESLKFDTMIGFINNDHLLRTQLIDHLSVSKRVRNIFHLVSLLQKKNHCDFFLHRFGITSRASETYKRCGFSHKLCVYPIWLMMCFQCVIWLCWASVNTPPSYMSGFRARRGVFDADDRIRLTKGPTAYEP